MESLKLHENDVTVMKQFYQQELEKTMKHLQHIKSVLESLGDKATQIQINVKGSSKALSVTTSDTSGVKRGPGRPRKIEVPGAVAKTIKTRGKKRGPESVWGTFILDKLKDSDKPMTYQHLVDAAMSRFGLTEAKRKATSDAIINAAFRLRKNAKKIDTFSAGQREKHVALKTWFDAPGKIGAVYMEKAKSDLVKPNVAKTAKAAKTTKVVKAAKAAPAVKPVKKGKVGRPAKVNKVVKPVKIAAKKSANAVVSTEPKKRGRKPNLQIQKLKEVIKQVKSGSSSGSAASAAKTKSASAKKVTKPVAKATPKAVSKVVASLKTKPAKSAAKVKVAPKKAATAKVKVTAAKAKSGAPKAVKKSTETKK